MRIYRYTCICMYLHIHVSATYISSYLYRISVFNICVHCLHLIFLTGSISIRISTSISIFVPMSMSLSMSMSVYLQHLSQLVSIFTFVSISISASMIAFIFILMAMYTYMSVYVHIYIRVFISIGMSMSTVSKSQSPIPASRIRFTQCGAVCELLLRPAPQIGPGRRQHPRLVGLPGILTERPCRTRPQAVLPPGRLRWASGSRVEAELEGGAAQAVELAAWADAAWRVGIWEGEY